MFDSPDVTYSPWRSLIYISWWERILLHFKFARISCDTYTGECITYKHLLGRTYIIDHFRGSKEQLNYRGTKYNI